MNQRTTDASGEIFGPEAVPLTGVGLPVFYRNNVQLGRITEVSRVAFRIDVPWDGGSGWATT